MAESYKAAGVDIEAGDQTVELIKESVASTHVPGVMGAIGGFGGLFDLRAAGVGPDDLLVSGTDGVGTKLKLAFTTGIHNSIGIDCVAMCVNDVLTLGARPLFFLDYLAVGKLEPSVAAEIVSGIAAGCRESGCALIGGETAEMPGFYTPGEYDVAGFVVGAVHRDRVVDGSRVGAGDAVIALPSSGPHSNGFSLIRRVLVPEEGAAEALRETPPGLGAPLAQVLLAPTRLYAKPIIGLLAAGATVHAMVHVTGGGLIGNVPRVLPDHLGVQLERAPLDALRAPVFDLIQKRGEIAEREMFTVFNMGVGFVLIVPHGRADAITAQLDGAVRIGRVVSRGQGGAPISIPGVG